MLHKLFDKIKQYNPYYRIKNLEYDKEILEIRIKQYEELERRKIDEKHEIGIGCIGCKNLIQESVRSSLGLEIVQKACKLDCKCEDRIEENE